jgi:DNA (cytosine-5)-methyltransferase 1
MIGNAMPPPFAYYVALAFQNYKASKLKPLKAGIRNFRSPDLKPPVTPPEKAGAKYPTDRKFRFAIPSLRLKSGVRFELANSFMNGRPEWSVAFYFGNSKSIQQIALTRMLNTELVRLIPKRLMKTVAKELLVLAEHFEAADIAHMQDVWSHRGPGGTRPFMLLDQLDMAGHRIGKLLSKDQMGVAQTVVSRAIAYQHGGKSRDALPGTEKLLGNAPLICAGLLIGSLANMKLQQFAIEQKFRGARGFRSGARTGRV